MSAIRVALVALALGIVLAVGTFTVRGAHDVYRGDARSSLLVAEAPFGTGSTVAADPDVGSHGVAYRFGRILFPLTAWLAAGGRSGLVRWTLPAVGVLSFAACAGIAAALCADAGKPAERGLLVAGVPTLVAATVLVYAEPLAVALLVATFCCYLRERRGWALALACLVVLTREVYVVGLLPLAVSELRRRSVRQAASVAVIAVLPAALWQGWVRIRIGQWSFLDPARSRRDAVGLPVVSLFRALRDAQGNVVVVAGALLVALVAVGTFVAAVVVYRRLGGDRLLASAALAFAVLGLLVGAEGYRFSGDGLRVLLPAHVVLALIGARARAAPVAR